MIALFARAPEQGKVKTRLAKTHGDEFSLMLARAMLSDTLALCEQVSVETRLFLTPDVAEGSTLSEGRTQPQGEGDLWERVLRADATLREEGFERVVIIGSDSPDLSPLLLNRAFHFLEKYAFVVGPSSDGGFYLLGSSRPLPDTLFKGVTISSRETFAALKNNLDRLESEQGMSYAKLPEWRDVDDETDLRLFVERLRDGGASAPRCRAVLREYRLL